MAAITTAIIAGAALVGAGAQAVESKKAGKKAEQSARRQGRAIEAESRRLQESEENARQQAVQGQARRRRRALLGSLNTGRQGTILTGALGGLGQTPQTQKSLLGA